MEKLKELQITKDELDRFGNALKQKEFRDLLVEYCEELADPASRKQYEEEITELEKERGVDVTFIHPTPNYVIKCSFDGNKLGFINVCSSDLVDKPTSKSACQDGSRGLQWSLPHLLAPPRDDVNKKSARCFVYDVIFHPETLYLSSKNPQFKEMVNKISCEALEANFSIAIDKTNLKFPKMKYKGASKPLVIRKKTGSTVKYDSNEEVDKLYSEIYDKLDKHYDDTNEQYKAKKNTNYVAQKTAEYAIPKYTIKHRSDIDLQDFTYDRDAKLNAAVPKELIVEINLPLLKSAADLDLDVSEKTLKIISEKPSKYKLNLTLPYTINEDCGNAKFDVDTRKLVVTLPVKRCNLLADIGRYDSGVEIDSDNSPRSSPSDKSLPLAPLIEELNDTSESSVQLESEVFRTSHFLKPDLHYFLPEHTCHVFDNIICFTLNVKNVDSDSIKKEHNESSIHIKFSSISSGYFPVNYAVYVQLPAHVIDTENVSIEAWDNNVIVQIPYNPCDKILTGYFIGTSLEDSEETVLDEPSVIHNKFLSNLNETVDLTRPLIEELSLDDNCVSHFLNPDLHYVLPEHTCHLFNNIICFTLNVKNVDSNSIKKEYTKSSIHIKFSSVSSGNYAVYIHLPSHVIDSENVSIEAWDNNVIVQIPFNPCDKNLTTYLIGTTPQDSKEANLDEPSVINSKFLLTLDEPNEQPNPNVQVKLDSDDEFTITINPDKQSSPTTLVESKSSSPKSRSLSESSLDEDTKSDPGSRSPTRNVKSRSFSESSVDESLSNSGSPSKKSILKAQCRIPMSRSISESSVDDYMWSSFENSANTSEFLIPEESEMLSSSMKKTVRFNDVVSKQLFRSNSSILGQRKKNQRKSLRKKRAHERKMSESENSEAEDKKSTSQGEKNSADGYKKENSENIDFKSDMIFDLDM